MSEYWIEIHPEETPYIIVSDKIIDILKYATFPEKLCVHLILIDKTITIIFYKNAPNFDKIATLIDNKIINIEYTNIGKIYKSTHKIFTTFEQKDVFQKTNLTFDVFTIDFVIDTEPIKEDLETLDGIFV